MWRILATNNILNVSHSSKQQASSNNHMGSDGWLTLFLSNTFIVLGAGISLFWKTYKVVRTAHESPVDTQERIELILVPCMCLEQGNPNRDFMQRLDRAFLLHQTHNASLLLLGGYTGGPISEAAAGEAYLLNKGVPHSHLMLEEGSRNTLENLQNARELIRENGFERLAITSNRYHLARCQILAHGFGLNTLLCAAEEQRHVTIYQWPKLLLEAYYLHWLTVGKYWSRLTRNTHSLKRIS